MLRSPHPAASPLAAFLCCFLTYALVILLCAPFALRPVRAASSGAKKMETDAATSSTAQPLPQARGRHRAGELLIRFREGFSEQEKNSTIEFKGARRGQSLRGGARIEKLALSAGQDPEAVAAELRLLSAVEFAEPNFLISHDEVTPNDPRFPEQWALRNMGDAGGHAGADIGATVAWEQTTGSWGTVIAVIDSGIDFSHPDLSENQWTNRTPGPEGDLHGWDYVKDSGQIVDEQGHGTAIAGIIAATGNNAAGTTGVMWKASLMSLRVLDNTGTGDVAKAVEAIDYAVAHGAQVINLSWGTEGASLALKDAIERAGRNGVVVVCSAGNNGRDIEAAPYYPASFDSRNLIAVAATDNADQLAGWSNWGASRVLLAAPGTNILTTKMSGGYWMVNGTSAAAPLVSGVAGLIKSTRWWLSAAGTVAAIRNGVRPVAELAGKVSTAGVVSASGALAVLRGPDAPPPGNGNNNGGNNGNNNGGNGNNNGNNGQGNGNPPGGQGHIGQTPPFNGGWNGRGSRGTPPPTSTGAPGPNLPNLHELRKLKPSDPAPTPAPIRSNLLCADCDPGGGGGYPANDPNFSTARLRPLNQTGQPGVSMGSRNFNWSLPILNLPGRAGHDLSLTLVYNSLVWTKDASNIKYNADHGFPGPGFRLGFPYLQRQFQNSQTGQWSYLMVTPSGGRVELRPTGTANIYEAADSTYTHLNMAASGGPVVTTSDGTQLRFESSVQNEYRCNRIMDRNGNSISVAYDTYGHIVTVTDTLGRVITFNYPNQDQNLLRFAIACDLGAQAARLPTSRRRVSNFRHHARCMSGAPVFALEALTAGEPPALPAKSIAWPSVASICKPL